MPWPVATSRFEIEGLAGEGGMGEVYRAVDRETGERVALKVLHKVSGTDLARFAREAEVLSELAHPNVVRYVAHGEAEGRPYLAMEWIEGITLQERLRGDPLALADILLLGAALADALSFAHARGIVHRDIKPSNVVLASGRIDRAKVVDFGLARRDEGDAELTKSGIMVGTPRYMAPEQARAARDVSSAADVYSLGGVLFRCITGRNTFVADDVLGLLVQLVASDPPRLAEFSPFAPVPLDDLIAEMLARDPLDRPTAIDAAARLRKLDVVTDATPMSAVPRSLARPELTGSEQPFRWLVVARLASPVGERFAVLRGRVERLAGRLELLADGSLLVVAEGKGGATELANAAARAALAIRALIPDASIALFGSRSSRNDSIGGASAQFALTSTTSEGGIVVDADAAKLLAERFSLRLDPAGIVLVEESSSGAERTLLGRRAPFAGRDRELLTLDAVFDESVREAVGRAVVVKGPAGIGKSRLRDVCLERMRAHTPDVAIWIGRGDATSAGSPFGILAQALLGAMGLAPHAPLAARRAGLRAYVDARMSPADAPRVAEFLGELLGIEAEQPSLQLLAARADAQLLFDQMSRAFEEIAIAEARRRPLVIVLEDLHWGDLPTVRLVDGALRAATDVPLLVLALARPEIDELFPTLFEGRGKTELVLGDLGRRASEQLVRLALGNDVDPALVAKIVDRAGGNAFFLEELVRATSERRGDELPTTVLAMLQARLDALDDGPRRLLRAASIFGRTFWRGGVVALLGGPRKSAGVDAMLDELVARELVSFRTTSNFANERELVFRHALVRDAAYGSLTDEDRTLGHRLAAAWLEEVGETDARTVSDHLAKAGEEARAATWCARAAERAYSANDFESAIALADRAMALDPDPEVAIAMLVLQADAYLWGGSAAEVRRTALAALRLMPPEHPEWCRAARLAVRAASSFGDHDLVVALGKKFIEAPTQPTVAFIALAQSVVCSFFLHDKAELALAVARRAEAVAATMPPDPRMQRQLLSTRAFVTDHLLDLGEYVTITREMVDLVDDIGDRRGHCIVQWQLLDVLMRLGQYEEAEQVARDAIVAAEQMRLAYSLGGVLLNLGLVLGFLGRVAEGIAVENRALEVLASVSDERLSRGAEVYLGRLQILAGDPETAREGLRRASTLPCVDAMRASVLGALALAENACGDAMEALAVAERAKALTDKLSGAPEGWALVSRALAEARAANGDAEGARAAAREACNELLRIAARISDPALRQTYLERVPDHARLFELATDSAGVTSQPRS